MKELFGKTLMSSAAASNILLGLGVLWAGQMLLPLVKGAVRPVAVKGAQGAIALSEQTSSVLERARNELSRIIEEAKYSKEMAFAGADMGLEYFNQDSQKEVEELRAKIASLENQLKELQGGV